MKKMMFNERFDLNRAVLQGEKTNTRMVAHLAREHQTDQTTIWKEMYETAKQQTA